MNIDSPKYERTLVEHLDRHLKAGDYDASGREAGCVRAYLATKRPVQQPRFGDILRDTKGRRWVVVREWAKMVLSSEGLISGEVYDVMASDEAIGKIDEDNLRVQIEERKRQGLPH